MHARQAFGELLVRELFFQRVLRQQAEPGIVGQQAGAFAGIAQGAEAGNYRLLEAGRDLPAHAAQVAQRGQAEVVVAGLAAVEQVVVDPAQRAIKSRDHALEGLLLQCIEQQARVRASGFRKIRGGAERHGGA